MTQAQLIEIKCRRSETGTLQTSSYMHQSQAAPKVDESCYRQPLLEPNPPQPHACCSWVSLDSELATASAAALPPRAAQNPASISGRTVGNHWRGHSTTTARIVFLFPRCLRPPMSQRACGSTSE
eukprot:1908759-Amphidinium_carterae.3